MIKSLSNLTKVLLDLQDLLTTSKRSSVFKYKYLIYEVKLILVGQTGQQILQNVPVSSGIKIESETYVDDPSSDEDEQRAKSWFFKITWRLYYGRDFSDVSNARKQQLERSLPTASVIRWAAYPE